MSAIGSLVFCTDCGNLLESSTGNEKTILICECCGAENRGKILKRCNRQMLINFADTSSKAVTTKTKESDFPSQLRQMRSSVQMVERNDRQNEAIIQETCTECGRTEMRYYTLQLRSADEGSTVFYSCECGYK